MGHNPITSKLQCSVFLARHSFPTKISYVNESVSYDQQKRCMSLNIVLYQIMLQNIYNNTSIQEVQMQSLSIVILFKIPIYPHFHITDSVPDNLRKKNGISSSYIHQSSLKYKYYVGRSVKTPPYCDLNGFYVPGMVHTIK